MSIDMDDAEQVVRASIDKIKLPETASRFARSRRLDVDAVEAGVGRDRQRRLGDTPFLDDGLRQAPDAVAAHLARDPSALYSHICRSHAIRRTAGPPMISPSAPMPAFGGTCARRGQRRRPEEGRRRRGHDQKVVAEPVVLAQMHWVESPSSASTSSTGLASDALTSIQRMRGCARKTERSWRTTNWRVRVMARSTASPSDSSPCTWARARGTPSASGPPSATGVRAGPRAPRLRRGTPPPSGREAGLDPLASHSPVDVQPDPERRRWGRTWSARGR